MKLANKKLLIALVCSGLFGCLAPLVAKDEPGAGEKKEAPKTLEQRLAERRARLQEEKKAGKQATPPKTAEKTAEKGEKYVPGLFAKPKAALKGIFSKKKPAADVSGTGTSVENRFKKSKKESGPLAWPEASLPDAVLRVAAPGVPLTLPSATLGGAEKIEKKDMQSLPGGALPVSTLQALGAQQVFPGALLPADSLQEDGYGLLPAKLLGQPALNSNVVGDLPLPPSSRKSLRERMREKKPPVAQAPNGEREARGPRNRKVFCDKPFLGAQFKASLLHKEPSKAKYNVARFFSALALVGIAGFGVSRFLRGDKKVAGISLLAAGALGIGREIWLHRMLRASLKAYTDKMENFLKEWPANKDSVPPSLQPTFERMSATFKTNKEWVDPRELAAFATAFDSLRLAQAARKVEVRSNDDRWDFVEEKLFPLEQEGAAGQSKIKDLAGRIMAGLLSGIFMGLGAGVVAPLRFGSLRRYVTGVRKPGALMMSGAGNAEWTAQEAEDAPTLSGEWPHVVIDPALRRYVPGYRTGGPDDDRLVRAMGVATAFGLGGLTIGVVMALLRHGSMLKAFDRSRLTQLDVFVSSWPAIRSMAPLELQQRFNELYEDFFDPQTQSLDVADEDRERILREIKEEMVARRKGRKEDKKGKKGKQDGK